MTKPIFLIEVKEMDESVRRQFNDQMKKFSNDYHILVLEKPWIDEPKFSILSERAVDNLKFTKAESQKLKNKLLK